MIDHVGLLPVYIAAGTAVLALLADLLLPGRWSLPAITAGLGAAATGVAAIVVASGDVRASFCSGTHGCSHEADSLAALVAVTFAALTVGSLALSVPILRERAVPAGEYCFLLATSMTGGVMLGGARDLILLIVAVETVTIPLYALVGLRRQARAAEASLTFFITSVVATSVALLGAGLIYAATGNVTIGWMEPTLTVAARMEGIKTLIPVGIVLLLVGLAVKVAAVPVHGWAAPTYDGASLPVAAFLSTASKFAGIISVLIVFSGLSGQSDVAGPTLAVLAVATMTVGNLVALRQRRMVRLLAWSSIAQGGYLLAPLGAMAAGGSERLTTFEATLAYTMFFLVLEFGAFAALIAVRGSQDGGEIAEYRGVARRSWWVGAALVLALTGLAGLPPGVAGLFAKVAVVQGLIDAGGVWLAVVVAINAVIALAYYARFIAVLFARPAAAEAPTSSERPSERPSQRPPAAEPARKLALVGAGRGGDGDSGDGAGGGGDSGDGAGGGSVPAAAPQPAPGPGAVPLTSPFAKPGIAVVTTVAVVTLAGLVIGLAPQLVLDVARNAAEALIASLR